MVRVKDRHGHPAGVDTEMGVVMVIFGEDVESLDGTLVGLFWFITTNVVLSSASTISAPRLATAPSSVEEYHRAQWALKSLNIRTSPVV